MNRIRPLMLFGAFGALVSLAACARQQPLAVSTEQTEPPPLLPELVRSARSIEGLWARLASLETHNQPPRYQDTARESGARETGAGEFRKAHFQLPVASTLLPRERHHSLEPLPESSVVSALSLPQPRGHQGSDNRTRHTDKPSLLPQPQHHQGPNNHTRHADKPARLPQPQHHQPGGRRRHDDEAHRPSLLPHLQHHRGPDKVPDLQRHINLNWTGELRVLLQRLAGLIHYAFQESGPRPALPVHISLHLENVSIAEALREAGLQAGQRAGVRVHAGAARRVELVYTQ